MRPINHETENSVATFSLRGECTRERRGGFASSIAFLTGVTALAFGLMFVLSTPSFATDNSIHRIIDVPGNINIGTERSDVIRGNDDTAIHAKHTSKGDIGITNRGIVQGITNGEDDTGVLAEHTGTGDIDVTNQRRIEESDIGIHADHKGDGDIDITNQRTIEDSGYYYPNVPTPFPGVAASDIGIRADHAGMGDIGISTIGASNDGHRLLPIIGGVNFGMRLKHTGVGDIGITGGDFTSRNTAVYAEHTSEGDIGIDRVHTSGGGTGIHAKHTDKGDIGIILGTSGSNIGAHAEHFGVGDIGITGGTSGLSKGLFAEHAGMGDIEINGVSTGGDIGTHVNHDGTGDIRIINEGSTLPTLTKTLNLKPYIVIGEDVFYYNGTAIYADHAGTGDIEISIGTGGYPAHYSVPGRTAGGDIGVHVDHAGTGDIWITNDGGIVEGYTSYGMRTSHSGTGDVRIINEGIIRGGGTGVYDGCSWCNNEPLRYADGRLAYANESVEDDYGIYADHASTGDIWIANKGSVFGDGADGIRAVHTSIGDVEIINGGIIKGAINGIRASAADVAADGDAGNIKIANKNSVQGGTGHGISALLGTGTGDIGVVNEGEVSAADTGIHAEHAGTGDIGVVNEGEVSAADTGIHARHTGGGNLSVVTEEDSKIVSSDEGIVAYHEGDGVIDINVSSGGNVMSKEEHGIFVQHSGDAPGGNAPSVYFDIEGTVKGFKNAILVNNSAGNVAFKIDDDSEVEAGKSYGIEAIHTGDGKIGIDLSGTISGGKNAGPINMVSADTKTLLLRPGFELKSGQSHVEIISAGEGDGILMLGQNDDPEKDGTSASETLDFEALDFQGFNHFAKIGQNTWNIRGDASDAEMFDRARISEGTLRFADGVTFKMSEAEADADPNYFAIRDDAKLEVVGSDNILEGNLDNRGKIVFTYAPDVGVNTLAVGNGLTGNDRRGGDYARGGAVVFDVGSGSWQADKLSIKRNYVNPTEPTKVEIDGMDPNFVSSDHEYLPVVIEVLGTANSDSFVTGEAGGYDVNNHKYSLVHFPETDAQGGIKVHAWKFRRGAERSTSSNLGSSYEEDLSDETNLEEEASTNPDEENSELGLRADISGHAGGVWGRQQNLHTSAGPNVIASRGLRKEDHRVYFGYDTPAMDFMGGDMVVRTSVMRGLSISDAFSSSGRNRINMESDAASLSASWQSPVGFYAGGRTSYVRSSSNISAKGFAVARDNEGVGVGASAKAGYRFALSLGGMDFSVAPQVQLLWSRVDFEDFIGLNGEVVSLEDGELVTGRLALLWDGEWQNTEGSGWIYGKMNLHNAVDGETTVSVSGAPLSRERSNLSAGGRLGASYEWDEGYAVRGEVSALSRENTEEIRADFGMSIDF